MNKELEKIKGISIVAREDYFMYQILELKCRETKKEQRDYLKRLIEYREQQAKVEVKEGLRKLDWFYKKDYEENAEYVSIPRKKWNKFWDKELREKNGVK